MWNRDEEASTVRYEDELTTMETTTNWERLATVGYATTTEGSQPSERATGVLANEEVAYDLENDEIVNAEPSERASGVLTTEEVAFDLEEPYLRTEEPSERAIGALTTEEVAHDLEDDYLRMEKPSESATGGLTTEFDEETTRKTTANVCNGARCRCLEALPVEVKYVNYLPSKKAEGDASVVPLEKKTDTEESDPPATKTGVPPEYDRNAGPSVLEQVGVASEDGHEDVELTKESGETPDESAASTDAAPPPEEPPPPHARLFTEEELRALEARTPSTMGVELEEYDKELEERLFPLDEVERRWRCQLKPRGLIATSVLTPPPTKDEARGEPEPGGPTELVNAKDDDASINEVVASLVPSSRFAATTVDESRVIANTGVPRVNLERKDEDVPSALPFRLRTLVRSVVFLLILDEEAKNGERCPTCHYPKAYPPEAEPRGHFVPGPFSTELTTRAHELIIERAGTLRDSVLQAVLREISRAYLESVSSTLTKRLERRRTCWCDRPVREPLQPRRVRFDCSSLAADRSEALGSHTGCVEDPDDVLNYVCFVKDGSAKNEKRRPGLMEVKDRPTPEGSPNADVEDPVPEGKRVTCSVEGFEVTSVGFIDGLPVELLIDTGAIASLVDSRASEARPGEGPTATVPWQFERRTLEKLRTFAVVDHLHVHALLGTDALNAFRAVIDMEESVMTLMETGETIQLGTPRVEEMYVSRINSTVRLCPGGQPLVVANLMGKAPDTPREAMPGLKEAY
ncbi:hypothetical protein PR003_g19390 [Phytophthora rubi]|uniref:Peptidase A2 domain-containing protein n=1 Tax=Phytophthora rubi TaxID=129364 RepID=A0A6A4DT89_9STRA|nr:hypothetical protein PR003_g19390 [Phytophthora rubi]